MSLIAMERNRVLYLRLHEPARCGALEQLAWEMLDICQRIQEREAPLVTVALLGDAHRPFFVEPPTGPEECDAASAVWPAVTRALLELPAPSIACVSGDAIGPAWDLALACDLRLVSASTRVGSPEIRWGRMPFAGATQLLPRLAGQARALQLLLLGEILDGAQLPPIGLAIDCVEPHRLESALEEVLDRLRSSAPIALSYAREAVRNGFDLALGDGLRLEADLNALLQTTSDRITGINGFLRRRPVEFEGR